MTKVLIDHQKFSTQKYGGISRYFANIIDSLRLSSDLDVLEGILYTQNEYLVSKEIFPFLDKLLFSRGSLAYKLNQEYCKWLLKKNSFDVFHPTYYDPYFIPHLKKPLVITVHDMTHERLPEYFWSEDPLTHNKRLNIERADKIIAISETTKKDLIKFTGVDQNKIQVIYHGIDIEAPLNITIINNIPETFILYIGDRSGFKNFYLFMKAFKELSLKYPELGVVLSGGADLAIAEKEFLKNLGVEKKVIHYHVTDGELNYLYQKAAVFVYPSLHEGFGLPILEAFKAGCPIILSDSECFREVAANAAEYFNPREMDDLVGTIDHLITSESNRQNLIVKGKARMHYFPIETSLQETFNAYKDLN